MSTAKHTQGPWKFRLNHNGTFTLFGDDGNQVLMCDAGLINRDANARLVAAAPEFFVPEAWRSRPDGSVKQGSGGTHRHTEQWGDAYVDYIARAVDMYDAMLEDGIAPEQARMILPQSMLTSYYVTGSLAAFARFYRQRIDPHAQAEIQDLARQVGEIIAPLYPVSWKALTE